MSFLLLRDNTPNKHHLRETIANKATSQGFVEEIDRFQRSVAHGIIKFRASVRRSLSKNVPSPNLPTFKPPFFMDETTKVVIDRITIKFERPTRIPSGQVASVFYDCFQLAPSELARLAADAVGDLDHDAFDYAVGLAYSGILFAAAVAGGRKVGILQKDGQLFGPDLRGKKVVIVDDVVHTGRHLLEAAKKVQAEGGEVVGYVCIIDRSPRGELSGAAHPLGVPLWSAYQSEMV